LLQINYFIAVARYLNFTEAAKSLYVSQPAISRQISLLEQQIGVQLFQRTKRSVKLTSAGSFLLRELSEINEKIELVLEKTRNANLEERGSLSIGFLEALDVKKLCGEVIEQFRDRYPEIGLTLEAHSFNILREKLLNRSLDLIFTLSFENDETLDIVWESLIQTHSCIILSNRHPLAKKDHVTLGDCRNEDFFIISREVSPKAFDTILSLCLKHGFAPNICKSVLNMESFFLNVEAGLGVGLVVSDVRFYNRNNVRIVEIEDNFMDVGMAWQKNNPNSSAPLFVDIIREKFQKS